jgi:hypothetical protein
MTTFLENLLFVITHSAWLIPALVLFVALGFWYGCVTWLPYAWDLELALEEYSRLKAEITKQTLGEFFAFPKEGKHLFEFSPENSPPEDPTKLKSQSDD